MSLAQSLRRPLPGRHSGGREHLDSVLAIIAKLKVTLAEEIAHIRDGARVDFEAYNLLKNQALLELNKALPTIQAERSNPVLCAAVADLETALQQNQRELKLRLAAAQAVSNMISQAIREAQSDGTYSARAWWADEI